MQRLLVVDDEPGNLAAVRRIFAEENYLLQLAASGSEALALLPDFQPDLVLLDILMPGLDGYEVCRRIKGPPESAGTMVLLLSGQTGLEDRLQGYEAAADDYLTKPYDPEELRAKVRILLRLKGAQDELRSLNRDLEKLVEQRTRALISKEKQAVVGLLVHGIVHNLKGPLSGAVGYVDLAQLELGQLAKAESERPGGDGRNFQEIRDYLGQVVKAHGQLTTMIKSLLVQGRQDAVLTVQAVDLNGLVRAQLDFLQADLKLKHTVEKILCLAPDLPPVRGIASDFSQVVSNLIRNGVDAMHQAAVKKLTITTRADERFLYLEVEDTGSGIAPEIRERIFDPFFSTKAGGEEGAPTGTGLGLYTCRELVKGYGGTISVTSRDGEGSCFVVQLPRS